MCALIRSTMLSEIRGSINGTTYSRNRYGAYARNRTVPVNPRTAAQQAVRAAMTTASQAWRDLTDPQRTAWNNYASATPVTNRLGEVITLSGQAMFNKYQTWYIYQSIAPPTAPPASPGFADTLFAAGAALSSSASTIPNVIEFLYTNGGTTINDIYPVWISAPQSLGTTFFKGPWFYLGNVDGANRTSTFPIPFAVTVGQAFFTRQGYRDAGLKLANDLIQGPIIAETIV